MPEREKKISNTNTRQIADATIEYVLLARRYNFPSIAFQNLVKSRSKK